MIMQVLDKQFEPFITEAAILQRIKIVCAALNEKYEGQSPVFLAILNGSFMFAADVMKHINIPCEISFVKIASYSGLSSTGQHQMLIGLNQSLKNRPVIILEDIIDTGNTLHQFLPVLQKEEPASISIFTLLTKPDAIQVPLEIDYIGFEIPNKFVIGYGLDYNGYGRNLRHVYQLAQ